MCIFAVREFVFSLRQNEVLPFYYQHIIIKNAVTAALNREAVILIIIVYIAFDFVF